MQNTYTLKHIILEIIKNLSKAKWYIWALQLPPSISNRVYSDQVVHFFRLE